MANFESFKIIEETEEDEDADEDEANMINDDPETLGSEIDEISATTVEIVFETTGSPDTTMASADADNNEEDFEIQTTQDPTEAKKENGMMKMDFLKKMAKQALQRKYKKVKKPKQLTTMKEK